MAEPVVKFPAEKPPEQRQEADSGTARRSWRDVLRERRRMLLLVVLPLVALIGGVAFYLSGGRYATTDDAYVGAQKVLITPEISGKIAKVTVKEGQHVRAGDVLFEIDPLPFRLALQKAKADLDQAKTNYDNLHANIRIYGEMADLAQQGVEIKQRDVERKTALAKSNYGSQLDLDTSTNALVTARTQLEFVRQQISTARNQLLGNPDLPLDQFPPYAQAQAALADAQRNLDHAVLRAPIDGVATQVDNIQLGRFVPAGTPILSVIDDAAPWVDANLKESDLTYVAPGQKVTVTVDAFPDHTFEATVGSLSPGTGAQFAILPPQNATGNFVKVVQRVPVRIYFDTRDAAVRKLKAGMSSYVWIDTGHRRSLAHLFGLSPASAEEESR